MSKPTLKIKIESTKQGFVFSDNTGKFSNSNKTGWKPGEFSINNVTRATLSITLPNQSTPISLLVSPALPSLECVNKEILPADLGLSKMENGEYRFDYQIAITNSTGGHVLRNVTYTYHLKGIECCLEAKKKKIRDYESDEACKVFTMDVLYENALLAICKGDSDSADEIIKYLDTKCNCKCC